MAYAGLHLALETSLVPASMDSDALVVVNLIRVNSAPSSNVGVIIHDIMLLM